MTFSRRRLLTLLSLSIGGIAGCSTQTPTENDSTVTSTTPTKTTEPTLWRADDLKLTNHTETAVTVDITMWEKPFVEKEDPYVTVTETRTPAPDEEPVFEDTLELDASGTEESTHVYPNLAVFDDPLRIRVAVEGGPVGVHNWIGDADDYRGLGVSIETDEIRFTAFEV
ncbi:hypothetical protein [Haladaptatus sp. DJG-WS-42]|uniref:hypothetical protein n=1 Tax=Haladaptatus sp. DJG-WS-42 TaxID=3120516 RepID=UPI0030D18271